MMPIIVRDFLHQTTGIYRINILKHFVVKRLCVVAKYRLVGKSETLARGNLNTLNPKIPFQS